MFHKKIVSNKLDLFWTTTDILYRVPGFKPASALTKNWRENFFDAKNAKNVDPGKPYRTGRLSTVDLLELTS
jgi:hypothetical protein